MAYGGDEKTCLLTDDIIVEADDGGALKDHISSNGNTSAAVRENGGRTSQSKGRQIHVIQNRLLSEGGVDRSKVTYIFQGSATSSISDNSKMNDADLEGRKLDIVASHCHTNAVKNSIDKKARRKLIIASVLCLIFMIGEMVGGVMARSLAIMSDAAHLLTDLASFMISLVALYLASRPATSKFSFGWHRAEILGAFLSILLLWVLTGILAFEAVQRVHSGDFEINATIMLITSAIGVGFNILLGTTLHQHSHSHGGGHSHDHGHAHSHGNSASSKRSTSVVSTTRSYGTLRDPDSTVHSVNIPTEDDHQGSVIEELQLGNSHDNNVHGRSHNNNGHGHSHDNNVHGRSHDNNGHGRNHDNNGHGRSYDNNGHGHSHDKNGHGHSHDNNGHGHSHGNRGRNINVRAAFIHVVGDLLQSIGVLAAAFIIYFKPEWKLADPICTFVFSFFVLVTTLTVMRDIVMVLMEAAPRGLRFSDVRDALLSVTDVVDIHDLRLWSLTMDKVAISAHLAVEKNCNPHDVLKAAYSTIRENFSITEMTFQIEEYIDEMEDCHDCKVPVR